MSAHQPEELDWEVLIRGAMNTHMWSRIAVPGGWVYRHYGNPPQIVFVPFSTELPPR